MARTCPECRGKKVEICPTCNGVGKVYPLPIVGWGGQPCSKCKGRGHLGPCRRCKGTGRI